MKNYTRFLRTIGAIVVVVAILGVVYVVANAYLSADHAPAGTVQCHAHGTTHVVTIKDDRLSTPHVDAALCDTLTIANDDSVLRLVAFGPHDHHEPYDGVSEKVLSQGQSVTVTLNQAGTYLFHDHLHDEIEGSFTVSNR
ncbi:MAG TPA: cupredoxin domain-containing protein [Candidatus Saccharimonadales bacterium]|nr:cupredoxin domain-containing protein [Candidatus Saccharimonadales bacterium]